MKRKEEQSKKSMKTKKVAKSNKFKSKNTSLANKDGRRLITFQRIVRYGADSFLRNSWLSIAATIVMVITLLIILITLATQNILTNTVSDLGDKVDMSIYLATSTSDEIGDQLIDEVGQLDSVKSASFISAAEARQIIAEANSDDSEVLEAIKEATNKNPATLRVVVKDINDTSELEYFVDNNELIKQYISSDYKPSFAGDRRETIKSIGRAVKFIQRIGMGAGLVFVIVSSLIIFNTIRMAIFNRKEEIQMMKLIGANKSFIRGPFIVEATLYGLIAAVISTIVGIILIYRLEPVLVSYQITIQPTIDLVRSFGWLILLGMMLLGALIGVISSRLATSRYLKV